MGGQKMVACMDWIEPRPIPTADPSRVKASPARVAEVEEALRPFLPALASVCPLNADVVQRPDIHPNDWIDLFRRPLLADWSGPPFPAEVAAELSGILDRLDRRRGSR